MTLYLSHETELQNQEVRLMYHLYFLTKQVEDTDLFYQLKLKSDNGFILSLFCDD